MEAGRERPAPLGGHLAGITRGKDAMAPVGTVIPGRRSTASMVPRVGGTGMAAPVGRSGGSAQQPSPTFPWRGNRIVQETRAQIWPKLVPEYICRFMIDCLSPDFSLLKSAGCQTVNFGQLILCAFEKKK